MKTRKEDQSLPTPGQQNVQEALLEDIIQLADFENKHHEIAEDLKRRTALGIKRYGTPLQTFNGRDAKQDLYEELLDSCQYAKQLLMETKNAKYRIMLWTLLGLIFDLKDIQ